MPRDGPILLHRNFAGISKLVLAEMPAYGDGFDGVKRPEFAPAVLLGKAKKRDSWFN